MASLWLKSYLLMISCSLCCFGCDDGGSREFSRPLPLTGAASIIIPGGDGQLLGAPRVVLRLPDLGGQTEFFVIALESADAAPLRYRHRRLNLEADKVAALRQSVGALMSSARAGIDRSELVSIGAYLLICKGDGGQSGFRAGDCTLLPWDTAEAEALRDLLAEWISRTETDAEAELVEREQIEREAQAVILMTNEVYK